MFNLSAMAGAASQYPFEIAAVVNVTTSGTSIGTIGDVVFSGDGKTMFVGDPQYTTGAAGDGSVQVFIWTGTTWAYQTRLVGPAIASLSFGEIVAASEDGNTVVVGHSAVTNSVYVFKRTGISWALEATLTPSVTGGRYGSGSRSCIAISSSGDTIAVGAYQQTAGASANAGVVFVWKRVATVWSEYQRVQASTPTANENLGYSVALSDDGTYLIASRNLISSSSGVVIWVDDGAMYNEQVKYVGGVSNVNVTACGAVFIDKDGAYAGFVVNNTVNSSRYYLMARSGVSWTVAQTSQFSTTAYAPLKTFTTPDMKFFIFQLNSAGVIQFFLAIRSSPSSLSFESVSTGLIYGFGMARNGRVFGGNISPSVNPKLFRMLISPDFLTT